ncbi:hypothetical protein [Streptacidiphilus sp. EB129]|uniref:hypothetical protein n=1 Tax=Streptacidiphilus sp. EB129 TaxID=3156262 RepID=UPI0035146240
MKLRTSFGTAIATAATAGVLALSAAPAMAAAPVSHQTQAAATQAKIATHLSVAVSAHWVNPGQAVTITAHLDRHGSNGTVTIWGQDWAGGGRYVVARGNVDRHGNLSVRYTSYQNHTFWATFDGGSRYGASVAKGAAVHVSTRVSAWLSGSYKTETLQGQRVQVFHKNQNIYIEGSVSPNKGQAFIDIQALYKGHWVDSGKKPVGTYANGALYVNTGTDTAVGYEFRVQVSSPADARNGGGASNWMYLTSTN